MFAHASTSFRHKAGLTETDASKGRDSDGEDCNMKIMMKGTVFCRHGRW